jgi:hypothetical protein
MNTGRTYFKIGNIPWNKGKVGFMKGRITSEETKNKMRIKATGRLHSEETKIKMSKVFSGRKHSLESKLRISKSLLGRLAWNKGKSWVTDEMKKYIGSFHRGENNINWKGGITPLYSLIRGLTENKNWIKEVFRKDNYTCQECFVKGGNLEAHHIKEFSLIFREFLLEYSQFSPIEDKETLLRLAGSYKPFWIVANGKTLCKKCHKKQKRNIPLLIVEEK